MWHSTWCAPRHVHAHTHTHTHTLISANQPQTQVHVHTHTHAHALISLMSRYFSADSIGVVLTPSVGVCGWFKQTLLILECILDGLSKYREHHITALVFFKIQLYSKNKNKKSWCSLRSGTAKKSLLRCVALSSTSHPSVFQPSPLW